MKEKQRLIGEDGEILVFSRRTARDLAFKYVFQYEFQGKDVFELMNEELPPLKFSPGDMDYIRDTVTGVIQNGETLDEDIVDSAKGWKKERISKVCIAAMRLALYEMKFREDIPLSVSINEAVEIVKRYDDYKTAAFANGVLGKIQKSIEGNA